MPDSRGQRSKESCRVVPWPRHPIGHRFPDRNGFDPNPIAVWNRQILKVFLEIGHGCNCNKKQAGQASFELTSSAFRVASTVLYNGIFGSCFQLAVIVSNCSSANLISSCSDIRGACVATRPVHHLSNRLFEQLPLLFDMRWNHWKLMLRHFIPGSITK